MQINSLNSLAFVNYINLELRLANIGFSGILNTLKFKKEIFLSFFIF